MAENLSADLKERMAVARRELPSRWQPLERRKRVGNRQPEPLNLLRVAPFRPAIDSVLAGFPSILGADRGETIQPYRTS